jgi:replication factor C small subunit
MTIEELMWVEKYRPQKISELIDQEEVKERLKLLLERRNELPHLLFAGPPGTGKTTMAIIIAKEVLGELWNDYTLSLNASDERGINMVRERVKTFASYADRRQGVPFRIVMLDESDEMTKEAQTALRRIMEESSRFTRFILICNYSSGIIDPIQSRCAIFRFRRVDEKGVIECLKRITKDEKIKITSESVFESIFEATNGDLRQAINLLQAASADGAITLEKVKAATGTTVKAKVAEIIRLAIDSQFQEARSKLIELTRVYGVPESDFLKFVNEEISKIKMDQIAEAMKIVAKYDYRLLLGANPEIQLTAMLAELSFLKKSKAA